MKKCYLMLCLIWMSCSAEKNESISSDYYISTLENDLYSVEAGVWTKSGFAQSDGWSKGDKMIEVKGSLSYIFTQLGKFLDADFILDEPADDKEYSVKIFSDNNLPPDQINSHELADFLGDSFEFRVSDTLIFRNCTYLTNINKELKSLENVPLEVFSNAEFVVVNNVASNSLQRVLEEKIDMGCIYFGEQKGFQIKDTLYVDLTLKPQLQELGFNFSDTLLQSQAYIFSDKY